MRKIHSCFLLILLIFLSAGCATLKSTTEAVQFDNEEAEHTMRYVMQQASENTAGSLYKFIQTKETFIPSDYQILLQDKDKVVGMNTILEKWRKYASEYVLDSMKTIIPEVETAITNLEFANPMDFITGSKTGGTVLFESLYKDSLTSLIEDSLSQLDLSSISEAVDYYNAYLTIQGNNQMLKRVDSSTVSSLAKLLSEQFFSTFAQNEELVRTTPNAYIDQISAKVLGLD